jgi:hypothetical protein
MNAPDPRTHPFETYDESTNPSNGWRAPEPAPAEDVDAEPFWPWSCLAPDDEPSPAELLAARILGMPAAEPEWSLAGAPNEYLIGYESKLSGPGKHWRMMGRTPELALHSFKHLGYHAAGTEPFVIRCEVQL